jgi:hypothetical protein
MISVQFTSCYYDHIASSILFIYDDARCSDLQYGAAYPKSREAQARTKGST